MNNILIKYAVQGLRQIFRDGYRYKKAGVILLDLISQDSVSSQRDLFGIGNTQERGNRLMMTLDTINRIWGRDTIYFASQGIDRKWWLRADLRSPRYTTRWDELKVAFAN